MVNPNTSVMSLTTFERCPKMWYFQRILKPTVKEKDKSAIYFGRVIHSVFENFYSEINPELANGNPKQHFLDVLNLLLTTHWHYSLPESRQKDAQTILNKFATNQAEKYIALNKNGNIKNFYPSLVEKRIISKKYKLEIVLDRLNNNRSMADYKTNKNFPELLLCDRSKLNKEYQIKYDKEMKPYMIQAVLNAVAVFDELEFMPHVMIFVFVRHLDNKKHGGLLTVSITQEAIDYVMEMLHNFEKHVIENNFPCTNDKEVCDMYLGCEYRTYCDAESICWLGL